MSHVTLTLVACEKWFKKTALRIFFCHDFKNLFTSTLDTTIISKMSNTHWHPGKRCCVYPFMKKSTKILVENPVCHKSQRKWPECRNATGVSQVTPPAESIEMVQ